MKSITLQAVVENLDEMIDFINQELEAYDCPMKTTMQINIAAEEIFVNIANYAYPSGSGSACVSCGVDEEKRCAVVSFRDQGIPYNPLERTDPDVTLGAEERDIGGLGIYMVKKSMDSVEYEFEDGCNVLTIRKYL